MTKPFAHLHCHSHYSLLDGAGSIDRLVERARDQGMNALALTDHGNLHGALEFYKKAKDAGVKPIIGYEAYIAPGSRTEKAASNMKEASYHLTLLCQNRTGFKNLLKMASSAYLEGFYFKPRIDKELLRRHHEGIICLSGCVSSELNRALLRGHGAEDALKEAREVAEWFHDLFGDRYFIEIMNNGVDVQRLALDSAVDLARELEIPLVATSDCHYVAADDAEAQDVMLCINTGKFRTDANRMRMDGNQYYLRSPDEMYDCFPGLEDAVSRSQQIADSVDIDLELGKRHFPVYAPLPEGKTPEQFLRDLCLKGLHERYADDQEMRPNGQLSQVVMDRLDRELGVIGKLGFPNYFLIVWDFVHKAREMGVPATARGSGVGALVSYALYLSHVCPIRYDLLFERFLDESRKEAPDIDIDFCKERRGEVIRYVKDKYGEDNVAQIGTFGTLAARAAIKDVGRALNIPLARVNEITAMVPEDLHITLDKALEKSEDLRKVYEADGEIREVIDLARKIEGLARNVGTHAAAVVIADQALTEYVPLCRVSGKEDVITQWSMGDVERAGLLKMDFLGLRNLTILRTTVDLIEQTTGQRIDPQKFPLDDRETYALLQRGETKGVFQLESGGIRDLLQKMKPDRFADIIATNALYRPGPLEGGMVEDYVAVKHGRKQPEYKHPVLQDVLGETNGVMVYQEQVMRIINRLGGIELAKAYSCIKAISKKKEKDIAANHEKFIEGAMAKGLGRNDAQEVWSLIEKFAGYGFNKCVVGSTVIVDAETGERTTVEDLFHQRRPFTIHALGKDGKLCAQPVTEVVWNGRKRVYELTTRLGHRITATANHPLRTFSGWTNLADLQPGDRIAVPRQLQVSGGIRWPRHEVIVLAHLLAEGNTSHPTCLYFFNNSPAAIDDFRVAVECFPDSVGRVDRRGDEYRWEVCVSTGRDTRFRKGQTPWNATAGDNTATAVAAPKTRSGAYRWAEQLGILGRKAAEKHVPTEVFALVGADLELFLGRLWSGDGHVGGPQVPFYATSSEQLARDVQALLVRLGIVSRLHTKSFKYRYREETELRTGFTVHLIGEDSVQHFADRILPHVIGRDDDVRRLREHLTAMPAGREAIADSDIYWDTVVSIEPRGIQDTYDLTVADDHNFVADGLIVHNSHSTAYALIAYQTAYLKTHYPVEFMAALLSGDIPGRNFKKKDQLVEHMEDCDRMGIEVVRPDVNSSEVDFSVRDGKIYFALSAIKSCGGSAGEAVASARKKGGPFKDLFDFCERVDVTHCNKAAIETLIKAGAMDSFGARRAQLLAAIDRALQAGASALKDRRRGQKSLFGDVAEEQESPVVSLPDIPELPEKERLLMEKEVLGFYRSSHPLAEYAAKLTQFCTHTTADIPKVPERGEVLLGGMLSAIKFAHTKKPRPGSTATKYANFDLEDTAGTIRCIIWPEDFAKHEQLVQADAVLVVRGAIDRRGGDEANLIVNDLIPFDELDKRYTSGLIICLDDAHGDADTLKKVHEIVRGYPGQGELQVHLSLGEAGAVRLKSRRLRVDITPELWRRVDELLGPNRLRLITSRPTLNAPKPRTGGRRHGGRGD